MRRGRLTGLWRHPAFLNLGAASAAVGLVFATGGLGALAGALGAEAAARRFGPGPAMLGAQLLFGLAGIAVPLAVLVPRMALALVVASEFAQWLVVASLGTLLPCLWLLLSPGRRLRTLPTM